LNDDSRSGILKAAMHRVLVWSWMDTCS